MVLPLVAASLSPQLRYSIGVGLNGFIVRLSLCLNHLQLGSLL